MAEKLPERIADEFRLRGEMVWVQSLSELLREEASAEANRYTAAHVRQWRGPSKGVKAGVFYADLVDEIQETSSEQQAKYVAETEYRLGNIAETALAKHPEPPEPERGALSEEKYMAALEAWEMARAKAGTQRADYEEELLKLEEARFLALPAAARFNLCLIAWRRRKFSECFGKRYVLEIAARAVRTADNHSRMVFRDTQEVIDMDDGERARLIDFYFGLDTMSQKDVPTTPPVS